MTKVYQESIYQVKPNQVSNFENETGLQAAKVSEVLPDLQKNILRTWHTGGGTPDIDSSIEQAWKNLFGYEFVKGGDPTPLMLKGPPGQGKSAVNRAAMEGIANAMGTELVYDPSTMREMAEPYDASTHADNPRYLPININGDECVIDLMRPVLVSEDLAGQVTSSAIHGVPRTEDGYTRYSPPERVVIVAQSPLALYLLDDVENAAVNIKNALMKTLHEKKTNCIDLGKNTYITGTGNLGKKVDGTNTTQTSSASNDRVETRLVYDTIGDWCEREESKWEAWDRAHGLKIGTGFVTDFLLTHPDQFNPEYESAYKGKKPSSRSWSAFVVGVRNILLDHDAQQEAGMVPEATLPKITNKASGLLGPRASQMITSFYSDVLTLARPAALQVANKGLSPTLKDELRTLFATANIEAEGTARSTLRHTAKLMVPKLFQEFNELDRLIKIRASTSDIQNAQKECMRSVYQLSELVFDTGLVESARGNLIAQTYLQLLTDLVNLQNSSPKKGFVFGRYESGDKDNIIPSKQFYKILTTMGAKFDSAMRVVGDNKTALESYIEDAINNVQITQDYQDQIAKLNRA